jgi:hypothetical protein
MPVKQVADMYVMSEEGLRNFVRGAFKERVARRAHVQIDITEEELTVLIAMAPLAVLMEAMRSFGIWLTHKQEEGKRINRSQTFKGLRTVVNSKLNGGKQKTKTEPVPSMKPSQTSQERVEECREEFQRIVGDLHTDPFTLTEDEARELLGVHNTEDLHAVFNDTAMWFKMEDPEPSQQDVIDRLAWVLAQTELVCKG